MDLLIAGIRSSSPYLWYLTRATGVVSLVLLTLVVLLGVLQVLRLSSERWPRFVIDGMHRYMSLLALAFLSVHVATTLLDSYVPIGLLDAFVPFHSRYHPLWLGLGAAASDLLIAVLFTSLVRVWIGVRLWRALHWCAYASWPLAVVHGYGIGTDHRQGWMLIVDGVCVLSVITALVARYVLAGGTRPAAGPILTR